MAKIKLGVFGYGCVGQGLYDLLEESAFVEAEIVKICVKDHNKKRNIDKDYFTYDPKDILDDTSIDVVVELIDDPVAALEIVSRALQNGKAVVTANKKMVAENFAYLYELQQESGKPLLYEAAVCGSIPVIRNLEEYYDNDPLHSIEGIFNGSTNYILTKLFREGQSFKEALRVAQDLGFAETDPTLDVEGFDPKYKLTILIAHAFGVIVAPDQLFNYGISKINDFDIRTANDKNYRIKLVSKAVKNGDQVNAVVIPQFISNDDPLFHIENEFNAVKIGTGFSGHQLLSGKGAGSHPTGAAVLSDISALTYNYKYGYKKLRSALDHDYDEQAVAEVYVRYSMSESSLVNEFHEITESYVGNEFHYVVGRIPFKKLVNAQWVNSPTTSIILAPGKGLKPLDNTSKLTLATQ